MTIYSNSLTASYNQSVAYGGGLPAQMGAVQAQPASFGLQPTSFGGSDLLGMAQTAYGGGNALNFAAPNVATLGGGFGGQDLSMLNGLNGGLMQTSSLTSSGLMGGMPATPQYIPVPVAAQESSNGEMSMILQALLAMLRDRDEDCDHTHDVAYRDEVEPQQVAAAEDDDYLPGEKFAKGAGLPVLTDLFG